MHRSITRLSLLLACLAAGSLWADSHEILSESTTAPAPGLLRTVLEVQIVTTGATGEEVRDPLNRVNVTRVRPANGKIFGPILLRSPFNFDVRYYEVLAGSQYESSFLGNVARKRFDVWVVDDRINPHPPGTCESGLVDCSVMSTWTLANKVLDVEFTRTLIEAEYPSKKPVIGGFFGGSVDAMAAVNANPGGYSGFFGWQGTLYTEDQAVRDYNAPFCALAENLFNAGFFFDPGAALFKDLIEAAATAPNDPAPPLPIPAPPGLTNKELLFLLLTVHSDNPNFPTPDWVTAIGTVQPPTFTFADEAQFFQLGPIANSYAAVATFVDYSCGLAGVRTHNDNLGAFTGDVLMLGTEFASGPLLEDTGKLFTSASSISVDVVAGQGELDRYLSIQRKTLADLPFVLWARSILK